MTQKKIALVPLDGSAIAECVLPWAVIFAQRLNLRLVLLQLLPEIGRSDHPLTRGEFRAARHYLDGVAGSIREHGVHVDTDVRGYDGEIDAKIHAVALELGAELILIGTRGHSGLKRMVLGSVADGVIRLAACPVLVVRANIDTPAQLPEVRRIVVPLDGSRRAEMVLSYAARIAVDFNASLDLIHVVPWAWQLYAVSWQQSATANSLDALLEESAQEYLRNVRDRLPPEVAVNYQVLRGEPATELLSHVSSVSADIIVMGTHGRGGITRWALGSVADRIVRNADCPVMLLRAVAGESESDLDTGSSID